MQIGDWGREGGQNQTLVAELMGKVADAKPPQFVVSVGGEDAGARAKHTEVRGSVWSAATSCPAQASARPGQALLPALALAPSECRAHATPSCPCTPAAAAADNFYPHGLSSTDDALFNTSFMSVYTAPGLAVRAGAQARARARRPGAACCCLAAVHAQPSRASCIRRAAPPPAAGSAMQSRSCWVTLLGGAVHSSRAVQHVGGDGDDAACVLSLPGMQVPWHAVLGNHDYNDGGPAHTASSPIYQVRLSRVGA